MVPPPHSREQLSANFPQEANPFTYVEINGLKIPEPHAAYNLLWEVISGQDVAADGHLAISWKEALKRLTKHFSGGASAGPGGHAWWVKLSLVPLIRPSQNRVLQCGPDGRA